MLDSVAQDVRYAFRNLSRSPVFAAAAILTLSLGIGANTAIFSAIDEALFRPVGFAHSEQLADVFSFNKTSRTYVSSSYPDYLDFRTRTQTFRDLSAFVRMPMTVTTDGTAQRLPVEAVTGNFFNMLELPPVVGRTFRDDDDRPGAAPVAMVSEEIASAAGVGSTILIEDHPFTVTGIVTKAYHGTNLNWGDPPRVWIPLHATETVEPRFRMIDIFGKRQIPWLLITGRLKPDVSVERAQAEVQTVAAGIAQNEPATVRDMTAMVFSASRAKFWPSYRESIGRSLTVFAVAGSLVLLLMCANLSNLLLSRASGRRREFAIRLAIGAARARLMRQLFTENLMLVVPGFGGAIGIAYALGRILVHFPNALGLTLALDMGIEPRVLLFCGAVSFVTTFLFGLVPALESTRPSVPRGGHEWMRNSLVVVQVAFSVILLVGGGLFSRSVLAAWAVDPGFRTEDIVAASFTAPATGSEPAARFRLAQQRLIERLRATPGIESVTLASNLPLSRTHAQADAQSETATVSVDRQTVAPDFFRTLGIPLVAGREFDARDNPKSFRAVIVNQAAASRLWPGISPLGRSVVVQKTPAQVVGVVRNARYASVWEEPEPLIWFAAAQSDNGPAYLIVGSKLDTQSVVSVITREWAQAYPRAPLYDFRTAREQLNLALAPQRMAAGILGAFGVLALILAAVGLYSVIAYAVARRTREIGIRLAIGARPAMIVRQILARSMFLVAVGAASGIALSAFLAGYLTDQVKGVPLRDAATFSAVGFSMLLICLLAASIPARRAAGIDPQIALRSE